MQLYGLKNCDTCRAARKALPEAEFVDVRESPLDRSILESALERFGDALVNRSSTTWRGLSEDARARPPLDLLADHPTLMKRPLIVEGDRMLLGWTAATRADLGV
ncbi:arsenate reductase [Primorskyibacter flagellatus]|uniref:Arsenate reductase n=1 Tax=Primorskyibacter flagellatus TaxID=1387277 RepID=A0A917A8J6_9RHOB|nr:ArsC/Spx/MgsR family protein [Primorskyibacter flagellatus]GGE34234.1 arsenate reductase [Primorskyibacter flagellatus]